MNELDFLESIDDQVYRSTCIAPSLAPLASMAPPAHAVPSVPALPTSSQTECEWLLPLLSKSSVSGKRKDLHLFASTGIELEMPLPTSSHTISQTCAGGAQDLIHCIQRENARQRQRETELEEEAEQPGSVLPISVLLQREEARLPQLRLIINDSKTNHWGCHCYGSRVSFRLLLRESETGTRLEFHRFRSSDRTLFDRWRLTLLKHLSQNTMY